MTLTKRDKLTAILGSVVAVGILLVVFVIPPCVRRWQDVGFQLKRKQTQVALLNERLKERESLLAERDRLSAIIGSVLGPEAYPPRKEEPKDNKIEKKDDTAQKKEEDSGPQTEAEPKPSEAKAKTDGPKDSPAETLEQEGMVEAAPTEKPEQSDASADDKSAQPPTPQMDLEKAKKPADKKSSENDQSSHASKEKPKPKGVSFVSYTERVAKKSGVSFKRLSRGKPVRTARKAPKFAPVGLHLSFETQVKQLTKFLYELECGDRLVRIERADIRRDLKKPDSLQVNLNIVGYDSATGK